MTTNDQLSNVCFLITRVQILRMGYAWF